MYVPDWTGPSWKNELSQPCNSTGLQDRRTFQESKLSSEEVFQYVEEVF